MKVLAVALAASASGDYFEEITRLGDLYKKGYISEEQFGSLKKDALTDHFSAKSQRRSTLEAKNNAAERRRLGSGDTAPQSKCLASMVTETKRKIDAIADDVKQGANPTLAALWKFVVTEGGGSAQMAPVVQNNMKTLAKHADKVVRMKKQINNMNKELIQTLVKLANNDQGDCQPIEARQFNVGSNGQVNSSGSKYYFTNWKISSALIDGDAKSNVDAHDEACSIKTRGMCKKCVKVYGTPDNYHQMAWSTDGRTWKGFAVNSWSKCFGQSCPSAYGNSKSQGPMPLPITFKPYGGGEWQYAVYSQANGSKRIYEMEVVSCPNSGGVR